MSPIFKKLLAGFAATKAFEKVQEIRRPRQSFVRRNIGKLLFVGIAGGATAYLYKSGKLDSFAGGASGDIKSEYPAGPGTQPIQAPSQSPTLEPTGV